MQITSVLALCCVLPRTASLGILRRRVEKDSKTRNLTKTNENNSVPKTTVGRSRTASSPCHQGLPCRDRNMSAVKIRYLAECLSRTSCPRILRSVQTANQNPGLHSFVNGKRESFHLFGTWGICRERVFFFVCYLRASSIFNHHWSVMCTKSSVAVRFHPLCRFVSSTILKVELHFVVSNSAVEASPCHGGANCANLYRYQYITQGCPTPWK
jgi:hypothetical protein